MNGQVPTETHKHTVHMRSHSSPLYHNPKAIGYTGHQHRNCSVNITLSLRKPAKHKVPVYMLCFVFFFFFIFAQLPYQGTGAIYVPPHLFLPFFSCLSLLSFPIKRKKDKIYKICAKETKQNTVSHEHLPLGEGVGPWWSKALEAVQLEEITSLRQTFDFMTPPLGLSVCVALNDQPPGNHTNTKFS